MGISTSIVRLWASLEMQESSKKCQNLFSSRWKTKWMVREWSSDKVKEASRSNRPTDQPTQGDIHRPSDSSYIRTEIFSTNIDRAIQRLVVRRRKTFTSFNPLAGNKIGRSKTGKISSSARSFRCHENCWRLTSSADWTGNRTYESNDDLFIHNEEKVKFNIAYVKKMRREKWSRQNIFLSLQLTDFLHFVTTVGKKEKLRYFTALHRTECFYPAVVCLSLGRLPRGTCNHQGNEGPRKPKKEPHS